MIWQFDWVILACCASLIWLLYALGVIYTGIRIYHLIKRHGAPLLWLLLALLSWFGWSKFAKWLNRALSDHPKINEEKPFQGQSPRSTNWLLIKTEWAFCAEGERGIQNYWLDSAMTYVFGSRDWGSGESELIPISASYRQHKQWASLRFDPESQNWRLIDVKYPMAIIKKQENEQISVYGPPQESMEVPYHQLTPGDCLVIHNAEFLLVKLPNLNVVTGKGSEAESFELEFGRNSYCLISQKNTVFWCDEVDYNKADQDAWPYALKVNEDYELSIIPGRWPSERLPQIQIDPTNPRTKITMPSVWRPGPGTVLDIDNHEFRFTTYVSSRRGI
jgi:hypothetical protein